MKELGNRGIGAKFELEAPLPGDGDIWIFTALDADSKLIRGPTLT